MSACVTAKMAGGTVTVAFHGNFSNVALKDPNCGIATYSETHLALRSGDVSLFRRGGRTGRNAHWFAKPRMPLRIVKHAALLASVQNHDDVDIIKVKSLSDGSQLFTFGPTTDGPVGQASSATAQVEQPPRSSRSRSSGYVKRSSVTKRPPRTRVPSSKPVEEPSPEPALPPRPRSSFAKRSPIPHSSERAPATGSAGVPVAVSPTVTPAREGKTSSGGSAQLTGVRERTEAPVPTQERLRPKSRFVRASPIPARTAGGSARLAVSSGAGESSESNRLKAGSGSGRAPSSFRKRSPIAKKSARKSDAEEAEPKLAEASGKPRRAPTAFKKPSLVAGRPARKTAGAASAAEAPEKEEGARPKRLASAYKKASPFSSAGRTARKPGARSSPDVAGAVANGVAQAAEKVEKTAKDVFAAVSGASDSEGEGGYGSDDSDLQRMKLTELREIAKERKIKGMWTMKKRELIKALEVSFSEDV